MRVQGFLAGLYQGDTGRCHAAALSPYNQVRLQWFVSTVPEFGLGRSLMKSICFIGRRKFQGSYDGIRTRLSFAPVSLRHLFEIFCRYSVDTKFL